MYGKPEKPDQKDDPYFKKAFREHLESIERAFKRTSC
jgi:hypothetical protein